MAAPTPISLARFVQFFVELVRGRFYGTLHVQMRGGQITLVKREETWVDDASLPVRDAQAVELIETGRVAAG